MQTDGDDIEGAGWFGKGPEAAPVATGRVVEVALERGIDRVLDYAVPPGFDGKVAVGVRVKVPLGRGNTPASGYVTALTDRGPGPKTKSVLEVDDKRVLIPADLLWLARWIGDYYFCPLGTVLGSVIPAAVKKQTGMKRRWMVRLAGGGGLEAVSPLLATMRAGAAKRLGQRLLGLEKKWHLLDGELMGEEGGEGRGGGGGEGGEVSSATLLTAAKALVKKGVAELSKQDETEADVKPVRHKPALGDVGAMNEGVELNPQQREAVERLGTSLRGGFSVSLLLGVTGSGKTEVYLRLIEQVVAAGKQAIVLVPEISLTPQTVRRFTTRFPNVAVLHSGLTDTQRHQQWQAIGRGVANVVIGARSAIFAPVPNLGLVVVDEEHETTYKQDQAPRYHARDVAIMRAQKAGAGVVLGSATPSLESYQKASSGVKGWHLIHLTERARKQPMPKIELVDMKDPLVRKRGGIQLISPRLEVALKGTLAAGKQAIILLNRRGYSNFVYCARCKQPVHCKYCDVTLTYHRGPNEQADALVGGTLQCHYCLGQQTLKPNCEVCSSKLVLFGLGTQRVEEELTSKFPDLKFARVDSDTMRTSRDYEERLSEFSAGRLQVLLGTQMLAKGHDFPGVTLVGVISADTALSLPDFRSGERTFSLLTQVAGRAGRGDDTGTVVVQTFNPEEPVIQSALSHDYVTFADDELQTRQRVGHPPFGRMVRFIIRDQELPAAQRLGADVADLVHAAAKEYGDTIQVIGPHPCAINRIAGYHRQSVELRGPDSRPIQTMLRALRGQPLLQRHESVVVDVDPVNLL